MEEKGTYFSEEVSRLLVAAALDLFNGQLSLFLSVYAIQQILDWFTQMVSALAIVHDKRVIHRDLKTQVRR